MQTSRATRYQRFQPLEFSPRCLHSNANTAAFVPTNVVIPVFLLPPGRPISEQKARKLPEFSSFPAAAKAALIPNPHQHYQQPHNHTTRARLYCSVSPLIIPEPMGSFRMLFLCLVESVCKPRRKGQGWRLELCCVLFSRMCTQAGTRTLIFLPGQQQPAPVHRQQRGALIQLLFLYALGDLSTITCG